jgi:hypothetical protein
MASGSESKRKAINKNKRKAGKGKKSAAKKRANKMK